MKILTLAIMAVLLASADDVQPKPSPPPAAFTRAQIEARIAVLEQQREEALGRLNAIQGAIADYKYLLEPAASEIAKPAAMPIVNAKGEPIKEQEKK